MVAIVLWFALLLLGVWAAHWGADKLAEPLQKLRQQWGLTEAAGAIIVAIATAGPEISTNTVTALKGVSDIGLGNLLGSNIVSVPAIVFVAYWASRKPRAAQKPATAASARAAKDAADSPLPLPEAWVRPLQVKPEALSLQALPYLGIIFLVALLTIPPPWRGLQPIDGVIVVLAYLVYTVQAMLRRGETQPLAWKRREIGIAVLGFVVLGGSAYLVVLSTEHLVQLLGIPQLIGGLFITSTLSIVPEVFATWSIAKSGQVTAAATSAIADNTATLTLAFLPLAWVGLPIDNLPFYLHNLGFVALLAAAYAACIRWGHHPNSFELPEVLILVGIYLVYLAITIVGLWQGIF